MIFDAAKIEWKIEVTLASIKLKKVNFYFSKKFFYQKKILKCI
jgi:hypothetical protein